MKPIALLRAPARPSTLADSSGLRTEVRPPSLRHAPSSAWQRALFWLLAPAPFEAAPPLSRLPAVRADFLATLADLEGTAADRLRHRISGARSLRELWHLRSEIYGLVGVMHSQSEADRRVALLARHFPTRSPRSQLAPL
jgi:hypothetical protein